MEYIRVKTVEGRVARTSPFGNYIPSDGYVQVQKTDYIQRLLNVHGDIELEPKQLAKQAREEPKATRDTPQETQITGEK